MTPEKTCSACGGVGPFGANRAHADGLQNICKACRNKSRKDKLAVLHADPYANESYLRTRAKWLEDKGVSSDDADLLHIQAWINGGGLEE